MIIFWKNKPKLYKGYHLPPVKKSKIPSIIQDELVSPGWTRPVSTTMGLSHIGMLGLDKGRMEWSTRLPGLGLDVIVTKGTSWLPEMTERIIFYADILTRK